MAISIVFDKTAEEQIEKVVTPQKRLQEQVVVKSTDEEQIILPADDNVGIKKVIVEPAGGQKLDDGIYTVEGGEATKVTETGLYGVESSGDYLVLNSLDTDILYSMSNTPSGKEYCNWSSGGIVRIANDTYFPEYLELSSSSGKFYTYNSSDYTLTETNPFSNLETNTAYEFTGEGLNALNEGLYEVRSSGSYEQIYLASSAAYIADGNSFTLMPDGTYTVSSGEYSDVNYGGDGAALRATSSGQSVEYVDTGVYNIINENGYSYFEDYYGLTDGVYKVSEGHADRVWFSESKAYTGYSSGADYTEMDAGIYTVDGQGYVEPLEGGLYWITESAYGSGGTRYAHSDELPESMSSDDAIIGFSSGSIYSHVIISDIGESETLTIGQHHYTITRND